MSFNGANDATITKVVVKKKPNNKNLKHRVVKFLKNTITETTVVIHDEGNAKTKVKLSEPGSIGIRNIGSICYMISVIQCLSNTQSFFDYFVKNIDFNGSPVNPKKLLGITPEFRSVLVNIWSGLKKNINPAKLCRHNIFTAAINCITHHITQEIQIRSYNLYKLRVQQDAHEFLVSLLVWLHSDATNDNNGSSSFISSTFDGIHKNIIICSGCKCTRTKLEKFNNIIMSVPSTGKSTLQDCLEQYYSQEDLTDYYCDICNSCQVTNITKYVVEYPTILIICLKRIHVGTSGYEKTLTQIDYPVDNLDFNNIHYNLYAMIGHRTRGNESTSGHYYANVKHLQNQLWYKFDDRDVRLIDKQDIVVPVDVYLLFYQKST